MSSRWLHQSNPKIIWCWFILSMVLPNILFWGVSYFTHTMRPWFNLDYIGVAILFCLPRWWWRLLASLALICTFVVDTLLLVNQLFPINNLLEAIYLLPLITTAPIHYQLLLTLAVGWLALIMLMDFALPCYALVKPRLLCGLFILCGGCILSAYGYQTIVQSQLMRYYEGSYNNFILEGNPDARLADSGAKSLSLQLLPHSSSDKILLILDESWGFTKNPQLAQAVLQPILANRTQFAYFEHGMKRFNGLTLQAELKELCQSNIEAIHADQFNANGLKACLPWQLRQRGYTTYGLHGSTGDFYERAYWYPKAGFQHTQFVENMPQLPRCGSFHGVCDSALFAEVKKMLLAQPKTFVHWMTLTTHFPYDAKDITDKRLQCDHFGLKPGSASCRNLMLHAQFFTQLAQWLQDPELKGLEVVIIGDHEPPILDHAEQDRFFQPAGITWVHFKLK